MNVRPKPEVEYEISTKDSAEVVELSVKQDEIKTVCDETLQGCSDLSEKMLTTLPQDIFSDGQNKNLPFEPFKVAGLDSAGLASRMLYTDESDKLTGFLNQHRIVAKEVTKVVATISPNKGVGIYLSKLFGNFPAFNVPIITIIPNDSTKNMGGYRGLSGERGVIFVVASSKSVYVEANEILHAFLHKYPIRSGITSQALGKLGINYTTKPHYDVNQKNEYISDLIGGLADPKYGKSKYYWGAMPGHGAYQLSMDISGAIRETMKFKARPNNRAPFPSDSPFQQKVKSLLDRGVTYKTLTDAQFNELNLIIAKMILKK